MAVALAAGCSLPRASGQVRIAGSDTMLELNRRLAVEFMRAHPGIAVHVAGGGTDAGVRGLVGGELELCAASRPFRSEEVAALHERFGTLGVQLLVARDALSVYLNPENPVRALALDELRRIFAGAIADWRDLGGPSAAIIVVVRPPSSGTQQFFRDHVLQGAAFSPAARVARRTDDVARVVAQEPGAIGFGGLVFGAALTHAAIDGVAPTPASARDGSYPLARYLYFYATAPPRGATKVFTDWCVSPAGQAVVAEVGFIPLWPAPA